MKPTLKESEIKAVEYYAEKWQYLEAMQMFSWSIEAALWLATKFANATQEQLRKAFVEWFTEATSPKEVEQETDYYSTDRTRETIMRILWVRGEPIKPRRRR